MYKKWENVFSGIFNDNCMLTQYDSRLETRIKPLMTLRDITGSNKISRGACQIIKSNYIDKTLNGMLSVNKWAEANDTDLSSNTNQIVLPEASRVVIGQTSNLFIEEAISVDVQTRARDFISRAINGIGQPPEKFQSAFMLTAASILIPNVVGEMEWKEIGPTICHEMGWNFQNTLSWRFLLAQASRRLGKTRGTSEMILNYALSTPGTHVLVYSNSSAQTQMLYEDIHHLISLGKYMYVGNQKIHIASLIEDDSKERISFRNPYAPESKDYSTIFFLPGITAHTMDQRVRIFLKSLFNSIFKIQNSFYEIMCSFRSNIIR